MLQNTIEGKQDQIKCFTKKREREREENNSSIVSFLMICESFYHQYMTSDHLAHKIRESNNSRIGRNCQEFHDILTQCPDVQGSFGINTNAKG